jgi:hypothetical protein
MFKADNSTLVYPLPGSAKTREFGTNSNRYKQEIRNAIRLRRKLQRRSGARAIKRRIWSRSARSVSFFRASSFAFLDTRFFMEGFFENIQHRPIAISPGCSLALDNIRQGRHDNFRIGHVNRLCPLAKSFERPDSINHSHEVELKTIFVTGHTIEPGDRIVRPQNDSFKLARQRLQFFQIGRSLTEEEIEIDGRDRRALQRGARVTDQNGIEPMPLQQFRNSNEQRRSVHYRCR